VIVHPKGKFGYYIYYILRNVSVFLFFPFIYVKISKKNWFLMAWPL